MEFEAFLSTVSIEPVYSAILQMFIKLWPTLIAIYFLTQIDDIVLFIFGIFMERFFPKPYEDMHVDYTKNNTDGFRDGTPFL